MSRARALLDRLRANADFVLAAVLVATGQVEAWSGQLDADSAAVAVVMLGVTLPLFFVRLSPSLAGLAVLAALAGAAFVVQPATEDSITTICAVLAAFWRVGSDRPPVRAVVGGLAGYALFLVVIGQDPDPFGFGDLVFSSLFSVGPWLAGFTLSGRAEREADLELRASILEDEREAEARAAVEAERARIARELHDVIAHSVSIMTVQAGAARLLLAQDPEQAREPILAVEETGREALAETRRLLGILRSDMSEADARAAAGDGEPRDARRSHAPRRASGRADRRGRRGQARARSRPRRLPGRPGGAHERAQVRRARARVGHGAIPARRARARDLERRRARPSDRTARAGTGSPACASACRSTAAPSRPVRIPCADSSSAPDYRWREPHDPSSHRR